MHRSFRRETRVIKRKIDKIDVGLAIAMICLVCAAFKICLSFT